MEIRQLRTFKAVADHRSFHRAARAIHYAQSTVSAQISALEEDLGVRVFERLGRRIVLTGAGESLYQYACKMIELAETARTDVSKKTQVGGSLTIRVPESFCTYRLPPVVMHFQELMPGVKLRFITCAREGLGRDLSKGVTDLAFLLADSIQSTEFVAEILGTEKLVFVAAPDHPTAQVDNFKVEMLANHTLLLSKVDCSYRRQLEQILQEVSCSPKMIHEFNSLAAIKSTIMAGVGVTLIPLIAVGDELERKQLRVLPWEEQSLEVAQLMIWHHDKWLTPVLQTFMKVTREILTGQQKSAP